jgi:hypothetical protein
LPSSNIAWENSIELTTRLVLAGNFPLDEKFLLGHPEKHHVLSEKRGKSDKT